MATLRNYCVLSVLAGMMLLTSAGYDNTAYRMKWVILKDCTVKVNGSTNVNKFSCSISGYPNADTLLCYAGSKEANPVMMQGRLTLPVTGFDCLNAMMTSDLRKTLKAKDFPSLRIHFISLEKYPSLTAAQEAITGVVGVELAGVVKKIEVRYIISTDNQGIVHLLGSQSIHFSDFGLTPPRKLGGMIRANDQLEVEFRINFRVING
jgi:hypothetical protein